KKIVSSSFHVLKNIIVKQYIESKMFYTNNAIEGHNQRDFCVKDYKNEKVTKKLENMLEYHKTLHIKIIAVFNDILKLMKNLEENKKLESTENMKNVRFLHHARVIVSFITEKWEPGATCLFNHDQSLLFMLSVASVRLDIEKCCQPDFENRLFTSIGASESYPL
ncbi:hypothetical protein ACJX0J_007097, partial [Zea mays]